MSVTRSLLPAPAPSPNRRCEEGGRFGRCRLSMAAAMPGGGTIRTVGCAPASQCPADCCASGRRECGGLRGGTSKPSAPPSLRPTPSRLHGAPCSRPGGTPKPPRARPIRSLWRTWRCERERKKHVQRRKHLRRRQQLRRTCARSTARARLSGASNRFHHVQQRPRHRARAQGMRAGPGPRVRPGVGATGAAVSWWGL